MLPLTVLILPKSHSTKMHDEIKIEISNSNYSRANPADSSIAKTNLFSSLYKQIKDQLQERNREGQTTYVSIDL